MTNFIKVLQLLLMAVVLGLLIWFIFFRAPEGTKELKEYWESKDFKTDTVRIDVDYTKLPKPIYQNYVPPRIIVEYKAPPINNKISINLNDSLITVIDSLQNLITTINAAYLQLYPTASKLIYGNFTGDTLQIDLLSIDGRIRSEVYPVNYGRFQYQFRENAFTSRSKDSRDKISKDLHGALYGYAGYGLTHKAPIIGLDYYLYKGKFRLGANTFVSAEQNPEFTLMGSIGYKLYGR